MSGLPADQGRFAGKDKRETPPSSSSERLVSAIRCRRLVELRVSRNFGYCTGTAEAGLGLRSARVTLGGCTGGAMPGKTHPTCSQSDLTLRSETAHDHKQHTAYSFHGVTLR
jgi:hypothetical protein